MDPQEQTIYEFAQVKFFVDAKIMCFWLNRKLPVRTYWYDGYVKSVSLRHQFKQCC